jgi:hypothetical protein
VPYRHQRPRLGEQHRLPMSEGSTISGAKRGMSLPGLGVSN